MNRIKPIINNITVVNVLNVTKTVYLLIASINSICFADIDGSDILLLLLLFERNLDSIRNNPPTNKQSIVQDSSTISGSAIDDVVSTILALPKNIPIAVVGVIMIPIIIPTDNSINTNFGYAYAVLLNTEYNRDDSHPHKSACVGRKIGKNKSTLLLPLIHKMGYVVIIIFNKIVGITRIRINMTEKPLIVGDCC